MEYCPSEYVPLGFLELCVQDCEERGEHRSMTNDLSIDVKPFEELFLSKSFLEFSFKDN